MSDRVKILCDHCPHNEVCIYKQDYIDILKAVENATVARYTSDRKITSKKVINYDFVSDISVGCKYYRTFANLYRSMEATSCT